jgi:hypothetical protein
MTQRHAFTFRRHTLMLLLGTASLLAQAQTTGSTPAMPAGPAHQDVHQDHHEGGDKTGHSGHMNKRMHERMQARQAKHLQELKAKLQLAPTQDTAWTGFTGVLQARPTPHTAPGTGQDWAQLSTPERLERMKAMRTQHQSEMNAFMDRRADATKALYAALSPEQQKVFDAETARMMKTRGHGHGHGHGMHGGRGQS